MHDSFTYISGLTTGMYLLPINYEFNGVYISMLQ